MINELSENKLKFLDIAAKDIVVSIITLQSHIKVLELLERTQEQAKELEVQQEELRQTNEELQEHTNALKSQRKIYKLRRKNLK